MAKVLIIGGGFAGLSAAKRLCRHRKSTEVTVIDKSKVSNFLPTLPDIIGRGISAENLTYSIDALSRKWDFRFVNEEVTALDLEKKEVVTSAQNLNYDYLIIASGSETNFYGDEEVKKMAYKLDDVQDAVKIKDIVAAGGVQSYIISGGGYTGIEIATALRAFLRMYNRPARIIIIERSPSILGPLPQWMKDYTVQNLKKLDIEVLLNSFIEKIEGKKICVSQGQIFEPALVIWSAGVRTAGFIQNLTREKNPQGRLKVDEYLRINENCFTVGDAAYFHYKNSFLRMAVQFAIAQGRCAAVNIIRSIRGSKLRKYHPIDLGLIVPMANNRSCGTVLGIEFKGLPATALHFIMCVYRSWGIKNKLGIIRDWLGKRRGI